jgi:hypothetical protein
VLRNPATRAAMDERLKATGAIPLYDPETMRARVLSFRRLQEQVIAYKRVFSQADSAPAGLLGSFEPLITRKPIVRTLIAGPLVACTAWLLMSLLVGNPRDSYRKKTAD